MTSPTPPGPDRAPEPGGAAAGGLHILITDPFFRTPDQPGATRTYDLARHLAQNGQRVSILAGTAARDGGLPAQAALLSVAADASAFGQPAPDGHARRFAWGAAFKLWSVRGVDAVIAADRPVRALPLAAAYALWRGVPLILDVRDGPPAPSPARATRGQKSAAVLRRAVLRLTAGFAKRVLALTPTLKEALAAEGVADGKIAVIPLGCNTEMDGGTAREVFADPAQRPYVVFAGAMTPARKIERLIETIAAMPARPARFVFCGDGAARPFLEARAFELGLSTAEIAFPGALARRDLAALLRGASAAIVPCSPEARGGFLFDALAAGKPVALLGHGWQRDTAEGRGAGVSLPNDPAAAGRDLADFLADADGLRRASQQAAALAAGRFNLERVCAEARAVVQDAVAADPRAAVLRRRTLRAKRALDTVLALAGLIVLSPVMIAVAAAVRLKMGGPVFFTQRRTGLHGKFFTLVKFRTMEAPRPGDAAGDAARLTPLGRFLRATSLDELPELLNVLKGDMSLVGPRPLLPEYLPYYDAEQRRRHEVKPGLTGWAQVNGRNAVSWEDRFALDVWYVDNLSLGLDLRILARTVRVALGGKGISAEGHATMPRFDEVMARRQGAEDV